MIVYVRAMVMGISLVYRYNASNLGGTSFRAIDRMI